MDFGKPRRETVNVAAKPQIDLTIARFNKIKSDCTIARFNGLTNLFNPARDFLRSERGERA